MCECMCILHLYNNVHLGADELSQSLNHSFCEIEDLSSGSHIKG